MDDDFDLGEQLHEDSQQSTEKLIFDAIELSKTDPGAMYEPEVLEALQHVAATDPAGYARYRADFKSANKNNSVTRLDKLIDAFAGGSKGDDTKADKLVELLQERGTFFYNKAREAFVSFERDEHIEVWPLQSTGFQEWAGYTFFKELGKTAGETTLKSATDSLSGLAKYDGEEHETFIRAAQYGKGYVLDLCNGAWSVVHIYPGGWEILKNSPVKFWRTETMREIPTPTKTGVRGVNDVLWKHLNILEEDRVLLLAFILECLRPETPFVIAELIAGQGCAKSTTQGNIRDLIDPNAVNLRAAPKTSEDIFVGAGNNWLASYNNLSHLSAPMQDALCTLATGGGFASRQLYTNFDEVLLECKRPVMMNGISSLATAQDLIDRAIRFNLPEIAEYREEAILQEEFIQDKPEILAAIYDLFAQTLKKLPDIVVKNPPRMADFTRLGEAMSQVLGHEPGAFLSLYNEVRAQAIINALDGSPVALAIQDFLEAHPLGLNQVLMKDALERLEEFKPSGEAWPKTPRGLGDILRRTKPGLKAIGINVIFYARTKKGVQVTIEPIPFFHEKNKDQNQRTPRTPHTPETVTTGVSADKKWCTLENQCTPDIHQNGQHTPNVHPTYTAENRMVMGKGVHSVRGVRQNQTQIFEQKKDTGLNQSTPQENADVEYF
ncbi:hypothetical protein [Desulfobacter sp.]|uniref:hypothetical protein n=1 Tax=Desulfobacter sp. TaxID=2294 RepID=UPI000E8B924A|nr:hypothetical protein [Desulfobacter sp.]HBT87737.1 hypothetical protein [Desulfobacter sp.]